MMSFSLLAAVLCLGVLLMLVVLAVVIALQNRQTENDPASSSALSTLPASRTVDPAAGQEPALYDRVKDYLRQGKRIEAVKVYREATGASLREAKDAVDGIERGFTGAGTERPARPAGDLRSRVVDLLRTGRKIEAIKVYRDATGEGLKEAKDAVEAIEKTL